MQLHSGFEIAHKLLAERPGVSELNATFPTVEFNYSARKEHTAKLLSDLVTAGVGVIGLERGRQDLEWVYRNISNDVVN